MVSGPISGGARAVARCVALARAPYSDASDLMFRAWLSPGFAAAQQAVAGWMAEAGMTVRVDAATNLVGRYEGATPGAPALVIGSHLDSVRDAGAYDGPLGIMLGIECVAALAGRRLPFAIEVYAFGDEEGSRFPSAMLTSRAVAGTLDPAALAVADREGVTVADALSDYRQHRHPSAGWDLDGEGAAPADHETPASAGVTGSGMTGVAVTEFFAAARAPTDILAYLEAHIEQGPALEVEGLALGVVTGIAAQARYHVTLTGTAGHAGTTAMPLRRDALAAAAEVILAVERIGARGTADLVATVGRIEAGPGVANVIPGRVTLSLDVRALDAAVRDAAAEDMIDEIAAIADRRDIEFAVERVHALPPSPCDARLTDALADAMVAAGHPDRRLASGAGHDAMVMAALCPTAMLFIRCRGGVSHNPAEHVEDADVEAALRVMLGFIDRFGDVCDA